MNSIRFILKLALLFLTIRFANLDITESNFELSYSDLPQSRKVFFKRSSLTISKIKRQTFTEQMEQATTQLNKWFRRMNIFNISFVFHNAVSTGCSFNFSTLASCLLQLSVPYKLRRLSSDNKLHKFVLNYLFNRNILRITDS